MTYPKITTIVCLTDLIFALDIPSNECALGLIVQLKSGKVVVTSINEEDTPDDNLIGAHERVMDTLLVEELPCDEWDCNLGSILFFAYL